MQLKTYRINVSGKVQGVFYRKSTKEKAEELNLKGTVENLENDVEIFVSGKESSLKKLITWCKTGPERAVVDKVAVNEVSFIVFDNFKIV